MTTRVVTDEQIAVWRPKVEEIAARFGQPAEQDDLVQEGLISVWVALVKGVHPTDQVIRKRMQTWLRTQRRQRAGYPARLDDAKDELDDLAVRRDEDR